MKTDDKAQPQRFSCTRCGRCCNRGPEIELGEATALADHLITRLLLKVHSLPLYGNSMRAVRWVEGQGSSLAASAALDEKRDHLKRLCAHTSIDRSQGLSLHLEISALTVDRQVGRCSALTDDICGIYDIRPFSCRAVPLHYSKALSTLPAGLRNFVATPGYLCDTTANAAVLIDDGTVIDATYTRARADAIRRCEADHRWKAGIVSAMLAQESAAEAGLPSYRDVIAHSKAGSATLVSMLIAWRVAKNLGLLSQSIFRDLCAEQASLIASSLEFAREEERRTDLHDMLADYEIELAIDQHSAAGLRGGGH